MEALGNALICLLWLAFPACLYVMPLIYKLKDRNADLTAPVHRTYPRVVGHDGVWCEGFRDVNGKWIPAGFEFTVMEVADRHYQVWDTQEAIKAGKL